MCTIKKALPKFQAYMKINKEHNTNRKKEKRRRFRKGVRKN